MEKRSKRVQYLIAFSVSLASVSFGCFSSWPAPVIPKFHDNSTSITITENEIAWMVAMSSPGFIAGSLLTRFSSDYLGRRPTILVSAVPAAIGSVLVILASKAWFLYIVRFIGGMSGGMLSSVVTFYMAEIAFKEIRGSLTLINRFMFNFGNLLAMCIGPFVSYDLLNYLFLTLPVTYFIVCWWIPESPYYLLKEGKVKDAMKSLMMIRACKDEKMLEEEFSQLQVDVRNEMRHSSSVKELFTGKKYRKAVIIAAGLKASQMLTGQLVIQEYLGLIIKESGTDINFSLVFIIFGVVRFIVAVMSSFLSDRLGRRPLLIYSYLGTGLSLTIVGVYFFLIDVIRIDPVLVKPYNVIPFVGIIISNLISTLGFYSIIMVVPAEIFPLNVKAVAITSLTVLGGALNFIVARGYQVIKDWTGLCGVFWFFGMAGIFGSLFSYIYVPETKRKSLRDIQIMLQGDLYEADEVLTKLNGGDCHNVISKNQTLTEETQVDT